MPLTTIKSSNIGTGAISSSDLDTTYLTPTGDGSSLTGVDSGLQSVQVFTTSGTWTKPSGISKVLIEVQGGGGGGSRHDSDTTYAHFGAAGGYVKKFLDVSSISSSTITVGSGGSGATSSGNNGVTGGSSSWADGTNTLTGGGGERGLSNINDDLATGGTATGGDINVVGSGGGSYGKGATGGQSILGLGGTHNHSGWTQTYPDATGYGAGGGAGYNSDGGTGAGGIVIVWEYK